MVGLFIILILVIILVAFYKSEHLINITGGFEPITIKLMEFNIENGGVMVDFSKVVEIIVKSNADIVALEEGYKNVPMFAKACKYPYHDTKMQILSKFPIYKPHAPKHHIFRYIEVSPGRLIVVSNVHLTDEPYGPNALQAGTSFQKLTKLEKETRLIELEKHIQILPEIAESGVPVFLTGDFNVPSHLDCTPAMEKQGKKCFDWPVSKHLKKIGFKDSFREVNKNPNKVHGHTWWVDREKIRGWNPGPDDIHDRIDFIYCAGPVTTIDSKVIGENEFSPWPSDHRAVMSTFRLD